MSRARMFSRVLAALALSVLAISPARAVCQFSWLTTLPSEYPYSVSAPNLYHEINVTRPYWTALGMLSADPGADWDVAIYEKKAIWSPCPEPECFCTRLANSVLSAGRTDFVIGDFNHNPSDYFWTGTRCY